MCPLRNDGLAEMVFPIAEADVQYAGERGSLNVRLALFVDLFRFVVDPRHALFEFHDAASERTHQAREPVSKQEQDHHGNHNQFCVANSKHKDALALGRRDCGFRRQQAAKAGRRPDGQFQNQLVTAACQTTRANPQRTLF